MIGADSPEEIREAIRLRRPVWKLRRDSRRVPYLIRAGVLSDRSNRLYYAAIGRSLLVNQAVLGRFTRNYFAFLPVIILAGGILGWFLTGRALRPLNDVVKASQRISGSNLSLRIASRGAGDELDHLIKTFNQMMDRLEDSFRHIKQFSTDVSHELRTPITAARGQLEVALFTAETTHQYREAIQNALEETERLSRLVNAMLLLSQAESGQLGLQKERLNLSSLLRESLEQFELAAEEAKVRLVVDMPKECMAEVDRLQFDRLVSNLLSNALKFTPAGGEVRVRLASDEGAAVLTVEDTGCGIPPDHVSRVFDRFYRVPTVESAMERGLGLGLSFVAWIVRAHNGKIEVDSTQGKGSRFIVTLPVTSPAAAPPVLETATREVESSQLAT
jgi:heavy metal sensor kinase